MYDTRVRRLLTAGYLNRWRGKPVQTISGNTQGGMRRWQSRLRRLDGQWWIGSDWRSSSRALFTATPTLRWPLRESLCVSKDNTWNLKLGWPASHIYWNKPSTNLSGRSGTVGQILHSKKGLYPIVDCERLLIGSPFEPRHGSQTANGWNNRGLYYITNSCWFSYIFKLYPLKEQKKYYWI